MARSRGSGAPIDLRDYQLETVSRIRSAWPRKPVVVLPTGAGKSVVQGHLANAARAKGSRVLCIAPRREIVGQLADHIGDCGVIMAGEKPSPNPVQVASIQTLGRRDLPEADLVMADEAHLARGATYQRVLEHYDHIMGFTATPQRLDGKGLGDLFDTIIEVATVAGLQEQGYLSQFDYYAPSEPDLRGVKKQAGEFQQGPTEERMSAPAIVGSIKEHYERFCTGIPTLLFAPSVEYSKRMARELGGEHVDAKTPRRERRSIFRRLRNGSLSLVCNVDIVSLGFDAPRVGCVIDAAPTASLTRKRQRDGRALRPGHGRAILLDHSGNVWRHGLPDEPVEWSLESRSRTPRECRLTRCEACYAVMPVGTRVCPRCGEEKRLKPRKGPLEVEGKLQKVTRRKPTYTMPTLMRETYRRLAWEGMTRGFKPGWARLQFKAREGRYAYGTKAVDDEVRARCLHVRRDGGRCRYCGEGASALVSES